MDFKARRPRIPRRDPQTNRSRSTSRRTCGQRPALVLVEPQIPARARACRACTSGAKRPPDNFCRVFVELGVDFPDSENLPERSGGQVAGDDIIHRLLTFPVPAVAEQGNVGKLNAALALGLGVLAGRFPDSVIAWRVGRRLRGLPPQMSGRD